MHFRFTFERMNENCCNVWLYTRNIHEGKNEGRFFFVIKFTKDCHNFKRLLLISCAQDYINMVNQSVSLLSEPWKRVNHSSNVLLMLNLTCNPYCLYLFFWVPANRHKSNSLSTNATWKMGTFVLRLHIKYWYYIVTIDFIIISYYKKGIISKKNVFTFAFF